jgi:hypothetical protein
MTRDGELLLMGVPDHIDGRKAWRLSGDCAENVGWLTIRERGKRVSFYRTKPYGEMFGMAFFHPPRMKSAKALCMVSALQHPYTPASKDDELSRVARDQLVRALVRPRESEEPLSLPLDPTLYQCMRSRLPQRWPDGRLLLPFGAGHLMSSVKNFVVEDLPQGEPVFVIYKRTNETCTVKIAPKIGTAMGFAMAMAAIVTS